MDEPAPIGEATAVGTVVLASAVPGNEAGIIGVASKVPMSGRDIK